MKDVRIAMVGFGTIGRGFAGVLLEKRAFLARRHGLRLKVVAIAEYDGSVIDERGIDLNRVLKAPLDHCRGWSELRSQDVLRSVGADIALELTPGNIKTGEPGLSHILSALDAGMHVVTSNKSPLAVAYQRIMRRAALRGREVRFEATVGGAIPLINLYQKTLQINEIRNIYGILNGTTNFILSKMEEESVDFSIALREAQELGYAETDCSYDVDGIDTAVKVVILSNAIMGRNVSLRDVNVTGIREINSETIELAKKHGSAIRLVGDVGRLEVSPRLIPMQHPLNIAGALNAVMLETDVAGSITITGAGAGPRETASSILSDVIDLSVGSL
ncbi:MAG: homoserine dehydrogenase [Candidatus Altiarchaeota archaeon]|nr:homoserine dehydrogenase [Candidatus Altiarchaeota archaeon]